MSLVTEDGTGKTDAESYCTTTYADTYHSNRGNTAWAALATADKEQALRKATDYMVQIYGLRWKGFRMLYTQALDWPRWDAIVDRFPVGYNSVPADIQDACASLALRASTADLAPDIDQQVASEQVGPVRIEYATSRIGAIGVPYTVYREIDGRLAKYLRAGKGNMTVARA